ncbi:hypothetical protein DQG23_27745 [Paenibacillus contaminans]|uniref:Uncharacterized protein n=1 Tax=Paenibacillus contaminans TaxID=450362 RepID=A0A329MC15_9BACL|nr:hypothetical protein DQG23_27745 [Paenibacillus contaminans]
MQTRYNENGNRHSYPLSFNGFQYCMELGNKRERLTFFLKRRKLIAPFPGKRDSFKDLCYCESVWDGWSVYSCRDHAADFI